MNAKTKKIVTAVVILATVGVVGYGIYYFVQKQRTKSGNAQKDERRITIVRTQ